ncbi:hypothetical protein QO003_000841 [Arthrobacter silviterrae]|nr:hypothetical protein [Arthrobacter silviterrae]
MVSKAVFRIPDEQETYIIGGIFFVTSGHLAGTRGTGARMVPVTGGLCPLQSTSGGPAKTFLQATLAYDSSFF